MIGGGGEAVVVVCVNVCMFVAERGGESECGSSRVGFSFFGGGGGIGEGARRSHHSASEEEAE